MEISCPETCAYLSSAREHPAAVVRRQQERDVASLLPVIARLTERQQQLFFLIHSVVASHEPDGLVRVTDADVADAAGAVASTVETASRGVLYEHAPPTAPAKRLAADIRATLADVRARGTTIYDGEVAIALRTVERGARGAHKEQGGAPDAYLALMSRLLSRRPGSTAPGGANKPGSSLILP